MKEQEIQKKSVESMASPVKNKKLNKQLILGVIFAFFVLLIFSSFLIPLFTKKKAPKAAIEPADSVYIPDFIKNQPEESVDDVSARPPEDAKLSDDEVIAQIEPFNYPPAPVTSPPPQQSGGSGGGGNRIETVDNPVQKQIYGIKGLTQKQFGTQEQAQAYDPKNPYGANPYANGLPNKSDYVNQLGAMGNAFVSQNDQSGKNAFASAGKGGISGQWNSPFSLWKGSVIPAVLVSGINSDLPGAVIGRVTSNVYSSLDGSVMLIPEGSLLYANYNSSVSYGQNRIQIAWNTLVRPDGFELNLGNMAGIDAQGQAGYAGFMDEHFFEYLKAMGIVTVFSLLDSEINTTLGTTNNLATQNLILENRNVINQLGSKIIDRAMNIQPTIKIKQGKEVNVLINETLTLPPLEPYRVTEKHKR